MEEVHLMHGFRGGRKGRFSALLMVTALVAGALGLMNGASADLAGSTWTVDDMSPADDVANGALDITDLSGHADLSNYQGAHENDLCPATQAGTAANKDDLDHVYIGSESNGSGVFLYLGWHRIATTGTTSIEYELNQTAGIKADCNGINAPRAAGDVLISYDFQGTGPFTLDIESRLWVGNADAGEWSDPTPIDASNYDASITDDGAGGELVVNLTGAGLLSTIGCNSFSSVLPKTRSSSGSDTNTIKEFIEPLTTTISNCGAVKVHKQDDEGTVMQGVQFDLYTSVNGAVGIPVVPAQSCTTAANGECTISDVAPGSYFVVEHSVPTGYTGEAPKAAAVTVGNTATVTFVNTRQPAKINIIKTDGTNALEGAVFTLYSGGEPVEGKFCTTDDKGLCSIEDILPPGTYTVKETTTPAGYKTAPDQEVTLALGQTVTLTFVDDIKSISMSLVKTVNGEHSTEADPLLVESGTVVDYVVTITNTGESALTISDLADTLEADLPASCQQGNGSTLEPGDSFTCSYSSTITGDAHNVASVKGTDVQGRTTTASDEVFVTPIDPAIAVAKSGPAAAHVGDVVTYTFAVTNPGDTGLSDVTVTDPKCAEAPALQTMTGGNEDDVLEPGETWTYTCSYTVTAEDGAAVENTVSVAGTDVLDTTVTNTDTFTFPVLHPGISIDKTANPIAITGSGSVTYTYVVKNIGDTTLFDIEVKDDILGLIGTIDSLAPGASQTLTKTVTVNTSTPATNVGTATGADVLGRTVTAKDSATISVVLGAVFVRPVELPRTGAPVGRELTWALFMLLTGLALVAITTRRRAAAARVTSD